MDPLLRKWLDEKNLEFNHDGYSQETLNALKEFANYVAAQQKMHLTPESLASSQTVVNASTVSQSDSVPPPAQAQVS